jgi:molybdopterin-containing oxidoreductase family iron-sulfur binding subunit
MIRREFLLSAAALGFVACAHADLLASGRVGLWVDVARCRTRPGCRTCQDRCHGVHNVPTLPDPADTPRWVGFGPLAEVLAAAHAPGAPAGEALLPVLCNHCDRPPCVRVCPAGATFARPDGAVVVDEHRCIGCRYCMAACPYGARSFNFRDPRPFLSSEDPGYPARTRGVVEKCNLCVERTDQGRAPACTEACPTAALAYGRVAALAGRWEGRVILTRRPELGTRPQVFYVL